MQIQSNTFYFLIHNESIGDENDDFRWLRQIGVVSSSRWYYVYIANELIPSIN